MSDADNVFVYIGTYSTKEMALVDWDLVKDLHATGYVGSYDVGLVTKDEKGKVHVKQREMATRHGGWGGAVVGALVGILFPPAVIELAVAGAVVGAVTGHLWRGMSRSDVKELGDIIDQGEAALIVAGQNELGIVLDKLALKAEKHVAKSLNVKVSDIDDAINEAIAEMG